MDYTNITDPNDLPNPETNIEAYLADIVGKEDNFTPLAPQNNIEVYLDFIVRNGLASSNALTDIVEIVTTLPTTPKENILYLVPSTNTESGNIHEEWIWENGTWEKIGEAKIDIIDDSLTSSSIRTYSIDKILALLALQDEAIEIVFDPTNTNIITSITVQGAMEELDNRLNSIIDDSLTTATDKTYSIDKILALLAQQNEASEITYDNTASGLTSTDVKNAIDELANRPVGIFEYVSTLPTTNIDSNKIYVLPATSPSVDNVNEEWYYDTNTSTWELIGGTGGVLSSIPYDIVKVTTLDWTLNTTTGLYEADVTHTVNNNKVIVQVYTDELSPNSDKLIDCGVDIIDTNNLKIKTSSVYNCEVFVLSLNVSTTKVARMTDAIDEDIHVLPASVWTVNPTNNRLFNTIINHNLSKTIVNVDVLNNVTGEPLYFIDKKLNTNDLELTIASKMINGVNVGITDDVKVIITYEII